MLNKFTNLSLFLIFTIIGYSTLKNSIINCELQDQKINFSTAPLFDFVDESSGYLGKIGERNVLVDLMPHLQIKNIDAINGICSYHVFKPNSEEFPFIIDIKDKLTGEAVIRVNRKEFENQLHTNVLPLDIKHAKIENDQFNSYSKTKNLKPTLDCNVKKEYNFFLQAHDCSTPSLYSNKIPVKIEVLDHDDYLLQFEQAELYKKKLIESDEIYENFMSIKARDHDCTNDGFACWYRLVSKEDGEYINEKNFPFKIDNSGFLSSTKALKRNENYEFTVRAFDCLNNKSFTDAQVLIEIAEPCLPEWTDYFSQISINTDEKTNLFGKLKFSTCESENFDYNHNCQIDNVVSQIKIESESDVTYDCEKCADLPNSEPKINSKIVLFSSSKNLDNNYETENFLQKNEENQNKIEQINDMELTSPNLKNPLSYQSFSKVIESAEKIEFDGNFGNEFVLSALIRRPTNADISTKEHILCGSDLYLMNRHHFGLYFFRGNLKFLMRKEHNENNEQKKLKNIDSTDFDNSENKENIEMFYPSLWEWTLYEPFLSDSKWHLYEIKINYPNASLYIDGIHFVENKTNSDIIDAYELNEINKENQIITYIGACYHARTNTFADQFEGDIAKLVLTKVNNKNREKKIEKKNCLRNCAQSIQIDLIGNENYHSIENSRNQLSFETSNLDDMKQLINKITYQNKEENPKGSHIIKLSSFIQCKNNGKKIALKEISFDVLVNIEKFDLQLEGTTKITIEKSELENGIELFKDVSIRKVIRRNFKENENLEKLEKSEQTDHIKLSKCQIKIAPERNTMLPTQNYEKIMFLQGLANEFNLEFKETSDMVTISGIQTLEKYLNFIRHLKYVIKNVNEISNDKLIKTKEFNLKCYQENPFYETNLMLIQLNITAIDKFKSEKLEVGYLANKQIQKFIVPENDDVFQKKTESKLNKTEFSNPVFIAIVVMCSCAIGLFLVFGVIRLYSTGYLKNRKKNIQNEENPQMEWDDSGLNITENPLEILEDCNFSANQNSTTELNEEEYSSTEDDEDSNDGNEYSSEEEPEKIVNRELEWDDTSLEIKIKDKKSKINNK